MKSSISTHDYAHAENYKKSHQSN